MAQTLRESIQPRVAIWLTMNFGVKDAMLLGDTLASIISIVCTKMSDGTDVTDSMLGPDAAGIVGNKVNFLKKKDGGIHGEDYKYTIYVRTAQNEYLEEDLIVKIRER